ncbi:MAG: DUF2442 domain-containing protein [Sedimentisphaerales bacterium]|nr:DUF2442 domain-containing protein [Sedimentisphaerales bacterium]
MKSLSHEKNTSPPEVTNMSEHGFWLLINQQELFLSFENFPWFRHAKISEITDLKMLGKEHLFWPTLDVDLSINLIKHPDKYKLVAK